MYLLVHCYFATSHAVACQGIDMTRFPHEHARRKQGNWTFCATLSTSDLDMTISRIDTGLGDDDGHGNPLPWYQRTNTRRYHDCSHCQRSRSTAQEHSLS